MGDGVLWGRYQRIIRGSEKADLGGNKLKLRNSNVEMSMFGFKM